MATVMLVDDDPARRALARRTLERAGHAVREATSGRQALASSLLRVDVILLDVRLPDIDGFEVCRRLTARAGPRVPVVHYSPVFSGVEDARRSAEVGAAGYLVCPTAHALLEAVQETLASASLPSPRAQVEAFLAANPGLAFCAPCIAGHVHLGTRIVRQMTWIMEHDRRFRLYSGQCVDCSQRRRVVEAVAPAAVAGAKAEIVAFLVDHKGIDICEACLASATTQSLEACCRTVEDVQVLPEFQVEARGRCQVCDRSARTITLRTPEAVGMSAADRPGVAARPGIVQYRGWMIDLLSYRLSNGWRPFALIRGALAVTVPDAPSLMATVCESRCDADEYALDRAKHWIDGRFNERREPES